MPDELNHLIYAAIMHNGIPRTVRQFEDAAMYVADMLKRRHGGEERTALLKECELFLRTIGLDSPPAAELAEKARAALANQVKAEELADIAALRETRAVQRGEPLTDSRCEYLYWPAGRCDKCGHVHNGKLPGVEPG